MDTEKREAITAKKAPIPAKTFRRHKALSEAAVVEAIRQGICAEDLVAGQRVVVADLCRLLGATRGTVQSALMNLVDEGLLERTPNRGVRVRVVGLEEALQIAEVRVAIESLCVARAAERITDDDIRVIRDLGRRLTECAEESDVAGFADLTQQISKIYERIADQPVAGELLERLWVRNSCHRFRLTYQMGSARVALPFWLDRIEAICNHDPDAAQLALKGHAEKVREAMKSLANEKSSFATDYLRRQKSSLCRT